MKNKFQFFLSSTLILFLCIQINAQDSTQQKKHKIAIFAPLYLDSAFDATNNYRYGMQFPKFINPGLEFYEGIELALDSLNKTGAPLEVYVYDTRSAQTALRQQLQSPEMDSMELIIAHATAQETWSIASTARTKKIPCINVNLPNDAGISNNPYFVMLNSTLRTHIDNLYRHLQKNYPLDPIIVFRKKGQMEDVIKGYFDDAGKSTLSVPLKLKYVDLTDSFTVTQLTAQMDSNHNAVCIAGTLDDNFGKRLCKELASVSKSYPLVLAGMPTFDNFSKDLTKSDYKGLTVLYSTPFYNARMDKVSLDITNYFNTKMFARPSDMVLRGYEVAWRFANLLLRYKADIASNLSKKEFNVFRELDIQPVINKQTTTLDYFENRKLYFLKLQDGLVKAVY